MANGLEANGVRVSWSFVSAVLVFTFWLGGLSIVVSSNADEIKTHKERPSHVTAATDVAVIKQQLALNSKAIEDIKKQQARESEKREQDKQEILDAIREDD